jgi:hypothetical protein
MKLRWLSGVYTHVLVSRPHLANPLCAWRIALLSPEAKADVSNKATTDVHGWLHTSATSVACTAASWFPLHRHEDRMSVSLRTRFSTDQVLQLIIERCGSHPVAVGGNVTSR